MRFWLISTLEKLSILNVNIIRKLYSKNGKYNKWLVIFLTKLLRNIILINEKLAEKELNKLLRNLQKR